MIKTLDDEAVLFVTTDNWDNRNEYELLMESNKDNVTVTIEFFA